MADMTHTWDGLEIAAEEPRGSTVVVRRPATDAGRPCDHDDDPVTVELLLLHRNAKGPDFEGDWAWTGPAGSASRRAVRGFRRRPVARPGVEDGRQLRARTDVQTQFEAAK